MSTNERDAIIGRAVREEKEFREDLGVIDKELSDLCAWLNCFIKEVKDRTLQYESKTEPLLIPEGLSKYVDFSRVVDLVQQRIECYKKLKQANDELVRIGVRPAPVTYPLKARG